MRPHRSTESASVPADPPATSAHSFTLLRTFGPLATKTVRWNGAEWQIKGYDRAKRFRGTKVEFDGIHGLYEGLCRRASNYRLFIVRAGIIEGVDTRDMLRRLHADRDSGEPATLEDAPRSWGALDWDSLAPPAAFDPLDPLEVGDYLRRLLPPEHHDAACVVQLTSGAGIKDGIRARLWFVYDRPLFGHELAGWYAAYGSPIDDATLLPAEPIYIAAPRFIGCSDPVRRRWALLPGLSDVVEVPAVLPQPARQVVTLGTGAAPVGIEGFICRMGDDPGYGAERQREGFRRPILKAVCSAAARLGPDGLEASAETLRERLAMATASAPQRPGRAPDIERYLSSDHFAEMVAWAAGRKLTSVRSYGVGASWARSCGEREHEHRRGPGRNRTPGSPQRHDARSRAAGGS